MRLLSVLRSSIGFATRIEARKIFAAFEARSCAKLSARDLEFVSRAAWPFTEMACCSHHQRHPLCHPLLKTGSG